MKLQKTYALHVLIMFYEIEMMKDWVKGIENMVEGIENPENIVLCIDYSLRLGLKESESVVRHFGAKNKLLRMRLK